MNVNQITINGKLKDYIRIFRSGRCAETKVLHTEREKRGNTDVISHDKWAVQVRGAKAVDQLRTLNVEDKVVIQGKLRKLPDTKYPVLIAFDIRKFVVKTIDEAMATPVQA